MRDTHDENKRNSTLDVLKGISVIFVIITHYSFTDAEKERYLFPFWIGMAVPVFMIISGYVNALSFERHGICSLEGAYDSRALLKRLSRFLLPFAAAYAFEEILLIADGESFDFQESFYLFLTGGTGPGSYYIPILVQFVFYFPIIFFIIKRKGAKGFYICLAINAAYELMQSAYKMNAECYRLLVFRYTLVIAFGCYMAVSGMNISPCMLAVFEVCGVIYLIVFRYTDLTPLVTDQWVATTYIAAMYIMPIVYLLIKHTNLKFAPLEHIGAASYSIFLTQMVYYEFFAENLQSRINVSDICAVLINLVICLGLGLAFYFISKSVINIFSAVKSKYLRYMPSIF